MRPVLIVILALMLTSSALAQEAVEYRVVAANRTSTMQKELHTAGNAGFRFAAVMGGNTAFGGKEVVVIMQKAASSTERFEYRLLATSKTATMQKEMQDAGDAGFVYVGQTVFDTAFRGEEVVSVFERTIGTTVSEKYEYRLLATNKTSTMQKELEDAGRAGFQIVGMTVGKTLGGDEVVSILRRPAAAE